MKKIDDDFIFGSTLISLMIFGSLLLLYFCEGRDPFFLAGAILFGISAVINYAYGAYISEKREENKEDDDDDHD